MVIGGGIGGVTAMGVGVLWCVGPFATPLCGAHLDWRAIWWPSWMPCGAAALLFSCWRSMASPNPLFMYIYAKLNGIHHKSAPNSFH